MDERAPSQHDQVEDLRRLVPADPQIRSRAFTTLLRQILARETRT